MPLALYDLEADIGETNNVAAAHPDVVKRLHGLAEKAREDLGDSLTNRPAAACASQGGSPQRRARRPRLQGALLFYPFRAESSVTHLRCENHAMEWEREIEVCRAVARLRAGRSHSPTPRAASRAADKQDDSRRSRSPTASASG